MVHKVKCSNELGGLKFKFMAINLNAKRGKYVVERLRLKKMFYTEETVNGGSLSFRMRIATS